MDTSLLSPQERARNFFLETGLTSPGKLLVAVSGGADSVCLLHVLYGLREELGIDLHVAHLNHRLRGVDSDADARYVAGLARRLGIPATIESADVAAYRKQHRLSLEEAAREVRYSFLAETAKRIGAERVAVGHTSDDNIETILLHLVRGSGTRGLRGLQPLSRWRHSGNRLTIIRPLLKMSRAETAAYCRQHRLKPRLDTSNLSLSPLRNRIRHKLLPLLRSYNPQVGAALLRTANIAADELAFFEAETASLWKEVAEKRKNTIILNKEKLLALPAALQRHLLRAAFAKLLADLKDIEAQHIEEMRSALDKPAGKFVTLPGGLVFIVEYDRYLLGADPAALSPFPPLSGEYALKIPGTTRLPGWRIEATITDANQAMETDSFAACLDFDRTGDELSLRPRRPGDRFQPLGMGQPKKLNQFMIDAKVPQGWRPRIPVVSAPGWVVWAVGYRIDERMKVTEATRRVLCLKAERQSDTVLTSPV
ncbi:MAG: tRNA lysidine(34) synthetase TilS [Dehalococcoidales bacterium]|nr:tRNA lysidine(34) synthetase TilS [Dehalococcoidales bacterium]